MSLRKTNLAILVLGAVGALLLTVMYAYLAESDPEAAPRMKVARLVRRMFRFRSAVVSRIGDKPDASLRATCTWDAETVLPWDESALSDVGKFIEVNYDGEREGIRAVTVRFRRETGSGCSTKVDELDLARPVPLTAKKK